MKILLSVNSNISECPLNPYRMFTEIQISGIVQWPFSEPSVPLNAAEWQAHFIDHSGFLVFLINRQKIHFFFSYQLRGFRVILLWITTHEINKNGEKACSWAGSKPDMVFLVVSKLQVRYLYTTLLISATGQYEYLYIYFFFSLNLSYFGPLCLFIFA